MICYIVLLVCCNFDEIAKSSLDEQLQVDPGIRRQLGRSDEKRDLQRHGWNGDQGGQWATHGLHGGQGGQWTAAKEVLLFVNQ